MAYDESETLCSKRHEGRVKENEDHRKSEQEVNESLVKFFLRTRNLFRDSCTAERRKGKQEQGYRNEGRYRD